MIVSKQCNANKEKRPLKTTPYIYALCTNYSLIWFKVRLQKFQNMRTRQTKPLIAYKCT